MRGRGASPATARERERKSDLWMPGQFLQNQRAGAGSLGARAWEGERLGSHFCWRVREATGSGRGRHWREKESRRAGWSFVEHRERREYLELYHRLDIALDTFPHNGHTTSLDALWMVVPVVSLAGDAVVSRAGLSQLTNLGLPELIAHSETEYVSIVARLATDLPRLAELRSTLRDRMLGSVLMDAPRFTRQVERAYRKMWRAWRPAQSPVPKAR